MSIFDRFVGQDIIIPFPIVYVAKSEILSNVFCPLQHVSTQSGKYHRDLTSQSGYVALSNFKQTFSWIIKHGYVIVDLWTDLSSIID